MRAVQNVLVVEDDPSILRLLSGQFRKLRKTVSTAETAAEARRLARQSAFDLVTIDLRLPDAWGTELLVDLRRALPDAALVLVTGCDGEAADAEGLKVDADHVFFKPLRARDLLRVVEGGVSARDLRGSTDDKDTLARVRREAIVSTVVHCRGNLRAAAEHLGLSRQALQHRLKKPLPRR